MILKTYLRLFTHDTDKTLHLVQRVSGLSSPDLRIQMPEIGLDLAAIGDVLIVGGEPDKVAAFRDSVGPFVVDDIEATRAVLVEEGAEITSPIQDVPTGLRMYARDLAGNHVEYVQWRPELVDQFIHRKPVASDDAHP